MPSDPEQARRDLDAMMKQIRDLETANLEAGNQKPETTLALKAMMGFVEDLRGDLNRHLTPWQRVKLARHPQRPYFLDFLAYLFEDFSEIHGDRLFADDPAVVCGMARIAGRECLVIGQQKGRSTKEKLHRNWGMLRPEGYRKALRA